MADPALIAAAKTGNVPLLRVLLDSGANLEETDSGRFNTAFIWATAMGHAAAVRLLIDAGANLSVLADGNRTASVCARGNGHPAVADMIDVAVQEKVKPPAPSETWMPLGPDSVALVGLYPAAKRKLTHIFNFETRERLIISENTKSGAETMADPTPFDVLPSRAIERALAEFERLGGNADRDYVLRGEDGLGKAPRKAPGLGGSP